MNDEPQGESLKLCPICGAILPPLPTGHNCQPQEKTLNLVLTRKESNFTAWCQAAVCAWLSGNKEILGQALEHAGRHAASLGVEGVNSLGDRHALLAKATWPDIEIRNVKFDQPTPPKPDVSQ